MVVYIIGIIICVIGGGMLGWGIPQENATLMIAGGCIAVVGLIVTVIGSLLGKKNVKPNRSSFDIPYSGDDAKQRMEKILEEKGFIPVQYGTESAYRLGSGFWTARKFVRFTVLEDKIILVAWVSMGMGNKPNIEMQLDDKFTASLPKAKLKSVVLDIVKKLSEEEKNLNMEDSTIEKEELIVTDDLADKAE